MNNLESQAESKKTLMNAVELLNATANRFEGLSNLSERMLAKFERTEDIPCKVPKNIEDIKCESSHPDIIDLFNGINNRLNNLLNKIGDNVERVVNMID